MRSNPDYETPDSIEDYLNTTRYPRELQNTYALCERLCSLTKLIESLTRLTLAHKQSIESQRVITCTTTAPVMKYDIVICISSNSDQYAKINQQRL